MNRHVRVERHKSQLGLKRGTDVLASTSPGTWITLPGLICNGSKTCDRISINSEPIHNGIMIYISYPVT